MYFAKAGKENTQQTLDVARAVAIGRGIKHVVVASTVGETGLAAARALQGTGINLVVVSHSAGFREEGKQSFDPELKRQIEALGGTIYTGTMVLHGLGNALKEKGGASPGQIVADSLRILGQGTKVCVEITAMAADAGLVPAGSDVIAVAGSGRGADTAAVIKANTSNRFFSIRLREYLAKPLDF